MSTEFDTVEINEDVYKCPHCEGFLLLRGELAHKVSMNDIKIEAQHWVEHWDKLPDWIDKKHSIKAMDSFSC